MSGNKFWLGVLVACQAFFLTGLATTFRMLPMEMATHFGVGGAPDAWTSRTTYAVLMTCVVLGSSSLMAGIFYSIRFFPTSAINLPHRDYWLARERRPATVDYLFTVGLWMAVCETLFFSGVHLLVVFANSSAPQRLSPLLWPLTVAFLMAVFGCIVAMFWRFWKTA